MFMTDIDLIVMPLSDFGIRVMLPSLNELGSSFFSYFLKILVFNCIIFVLTCLVEFTSEVIWAWSILCRKISSYKYKFFNKRSVFRQSLFS